MFIGGAWGRYLMAQFDRTQGQGRPATAYAARSKLEVLLGPSFFERIQGKTVMDFGCGPGTEAVEMAQRGAGHVLGVDIRQVFLDQATAKASAAGVSHKCTFASDPDRPADIIVSLDSFEHFDDPAAMLRVMDTYLVPDGEIIASFGPTWYHPYGGHLFSVFPWAHLIFTEHAMIAWRGSTRPKQTARTIRECGLNQITIGRFEQIVEKSPFRFAEFEARPIRALRPVANRFTRELCTSLVRCRLVKKNVASPGVAGHAG